MSEASYVVAYNPVSGGGRGALLAEEVRSRLREDGRAVELVETRPDRNVFADRDRAGGWTGVRAIVVVGGDGTLHEAIQSLARADAEPPAPPLVFLGAGTVNVFAREFPQPSDASGVLAAVRAHEPVELRVLRAGPRRRFALFFEAGWMGRVVCAVERVRLRRGRHGLSEFVFAFLREAASSFGRDVTVSVDVGGEYREAGRYSNVLVTRARRYSTFGRVPLPRGVGLRGPRFAVVASRTRTPIGHFVVSAVMNTGALPIAGRALCALGIVDLFDAKRARIETDREGSAHADAECAGGRVFEIADGGILRVLAAVAPDRKPPA